MKADTAVHAGGIVLNDGRFGHHDQQIPMPGGSRGPVRRGTAWIGCNERLELTSWDMENLRRQDRRPRASCVSISRAKSCLRALSRSYSAGWRHHMQQVHG